MYQEHKRRWKALKLISKINVIEHHQSPFSKRILIYKTLSHLTRRENNRKRKYNIHELAKRALPALYMLPKPGVFLLFLAFLTPTVLVLNQPFPLYVLWCKICATKGNIFSMPKSLMYVFSCDVNAKFRKYFHIWKPFWYEITKDAI